MGDRSQAGFLTIRRCPLFQAPNFPFAWSIKSDLIKPKTPAVPTPSHGLGVPASLVRHPGTALKKLGQAGRHATGGDRSQILILLSPSFCSRTSMCDIALPLGFREENALPDGPEIEAFSQHLLSL